MALIGFTDFSKLAFTITRKDGGKVTVQGNRCGGDNSQAVVVLRGRRLFRSVMPDAELAAQAEARAAADPIAAAAGFGYFFTQHDDYVTVKRRIAESLRDGKGEVPEGVASIAVGVETLKLAEYLLPVLHEQLLQRC